MKFETAGIHFLGDVYSAVAVVVALIGSLSIRDKGAIQSTKMSGNFGPKLNGSVRSNRKSFEKNGPPFEVVLFSRSDRLEFWLNGSRPCKIPRVRRQRERQKSNWLNRQTTTLHVLTLFVHFFTALREYDEKMPNFTFLRGRKQPTAWYSFSFGTGMWFLGVRLKKSSLAFDKVKEFE